MHRREIHRLQKAFAETLEKEDFTLDEFDVICSKCKETFGRPQAFCCKHPLHKEKKSIAKEFLLHFVTASEFKAVFKDLNVQPNDGLCRDCLNQANKGQEDVIVEEPPSKRMLLEELNKVQKVVSPQSLENQFQKRNNQGQIRLIKKVVNEISNTLEEKCALVGITEDQSPSKITSNAQDSADLMWIMKELKLRMIRATLAEKKSLLTVVPPSWSIKRTSDYFQVSHCLVEKSRALRKETKSILPQVLPKMGRKLSQDTKSQVQQFYYEDEVSRACAGQQDVLSVKNLYSGKRELKQKRYLLSNLSELYQQFKLRYPASKLGMSSFMLLRPKECVSLNSKGIHNVCVCIYHQNVKLLFNAIKETSIKPWIKVLICDEPEKDCYFRRCQTCINKKDDLKTKLMQENIILQNREVIQYRKWTSTDGTDFRTEEKETAEFLDYVSKEIENLLKHYYITNNQQGYLTGLKNNLQQHEIIVWGDFAENYSPIIQDAIQSEYFNNKQITVHPFTIYWKFADKIYNAGFCIISDNLQHDTNSFFAFQSILIPQLLSEFKICGLNITHVHYFSDGCAAQYKNRKNFINLYSHQQDFGTTAEWNFFSTAHGKGPCDAQGGTTKRLARTASLQGAQITSAEELYSWCVKNILNVHYIHISDSKIQDIVEAFN